MMKKNECTMRDGMEADILQINVFIHEMLERLESLVLGRIKKLSLEEEDPPPQPPPPPRYWGEFKALQRTLFFLLDFVDVETSLEKQVFEQLQLGKLDGVVMFKGEQESTAAAAATPTLVRELRITLNEILNKFDKFSAQVYLSQGLKYFSEGYNDDEEKEKKPKEMSLSVVEGGNNIHVNGFTFGSLLRVKWCEVLIQHSDFAILPYIHRKQLEDLIPHRRTPEPPLWKIETPQLPVELSDDVVVHPREEDKRKVIESLLSDLWNSSGPEEDIHVMSIVGGPGVGKTTLAKLVFNNHRIGNSFDMKMWVSMSNRYSNIIRTTISFAEAAGLEEKETRYLVDVVEDATNHGNILLALDVLRLILDKLLRGRKFLLILDGVSNEICCDWEVLRIPFQLGAANGSKILITTRSSMVSLRLGTFSYTLGTLLHEDCLSLVRQVTFEGGKCRTSSTNTLPPPPPLELSEPIEEMTKLLEGLPSVAVALGNFLHSIPHEKKLQAVRKVILSSSNYVPTSSFSSTMLRSYHRLSSPQLKLCFVYCGLFSKGYVFKKPKLILLWMAEGFLRTTEESDMMMEDVGLSYFEELFEKSFFVIQEDHVLCENSMYFMPDDVHDLAQYVFTNMDLEIYYEKIKDICRYSRHSTLGYPEASTDAHKLRCFNTFISLGKCGSCIHSIPKYLFQNLSGLRVLDLSDSGLVELPDSIRYLEHLRLLDLSGNSIEYLPEGMTTLHYLQSLKISSRINVSRFPKYMEKLLNLRLLDLGIGYCSFPLPLGFGKLTNLRSLRAFPVGAKEDKFGRIEELRELRYLRGSLIILDLENVEEGFHGGWLLDKEYLQELELRWSQSNMGYAKIAESLLSSLQPHPSLKRIMIFSYAGLKFPTWMGNPSFSSLETIQLSHCIRCEILPPLGQLPLLKSLDLNGMSAVKFIDGGFCGTKFKKKARFPKLKTLTLVSLPCLEQWTGLEEGDMPLVEKLTIYYCDMLLSLPNLKFLSSLKRLHLFHCLKLNTLPNKGLPSSLEYLNIDWCPLLYKSCKTARSEDCSKVEAVPHVMFGGEEMLFDPTDVTEAPNERLNLGRNTRRKGGRFFHNGEAHTRAFHIGHEIDFGFDPSIGDQWSRSAGLYGLGDGGGTDGEVNLMISDPHNGMDKVDLGGFDRVTLMEIRAFGGKRRLVHISEESHVQDKVEDAVAIKPKRA